MRSCTETGQAAVEAAIALPFLLAVLGLMLQPAILLYDRCVMGSAASELCRAAATQTASQSSMQAYALRRLSAVPETPVFHVGGEQGWDITIEGGELSDVTVTIAHAVHPLPLFGIVAGLSADMQQDGTCVQQVQASSSLQPEWALQLDRSPDDWIASWE